MDNLSMTWAAIYTADALVLVLFVASFVMSTDNIYIEKHTRSVQFDDVRHLPLTYIAWFVYGVVLDAKVIVIFTTFSTELDEAKFFGPNTMKTSLAIAGLVFVTFLATQHDVKTGHRKDQLVALTATVLFDILDGVDSMDNLFDKPARDEFPPGLDDTIIIICCINFLLPTIPLFTLAKTRFTLHKLPEKLELFHKLAIAYIVNLPLFITRMITWHGLSSGISIFLLKNLIAMGTVTFEVIEHFCADRSENEDFESEMETNSHGGRYISNTAV